MDIRIGAAVQCTDGPGGHITSIILNPITQHVTDVVVHEPGFLGSDVIVPVTQIEQATAHTLQMRLSRHDLAGRQSFLTTQYLPPSDDFLRTAPWSAYPYGGIYAIFLLDKALVVLLIGPAAGECDLLLVAVRHEISVNELPTVIGIQAQHGERDELAGAFESL
jgi:hypothetical protein